MSVTKEATKKYGACFSAMLAGFLFALSAHAASFTISDGDTRTSGQELVADGDTGTIQSGGRIATTTADDDGVDASGDNVTIIIESGGRLSTAADSSAGILSSGDNAVITNRGTISTAGATQVTGSDLLTRNTAAGIDSRGADARITNSGVIMTSGRNAYGAIAFGDNAEIGNRGVIITTNELSAGIASPGNDVLINNFGAITTMGDSAWGVVSRGDNARINNNAGSTITTMGDSAHGIHSEIFDVNDPTDATDAIITNAGRITTAGSAAHGINASGDRVTISSAGGITTTGTGSDGIRVVSETDSSITVSGQISVFGEDSRAIYVVGDGATTLRLVNPRIRGAIDLGGGDNTVEIEFSAAPSSALTFENAATINLAGSSAWMIAHDSTVATIDPTGFSAQRATLAAATRRIHRAVLRRTQLAQASQAGSTAWSHAFGGQIDRGDEDLALAWQQDFHGLLGGYQSVRASGNHLGWFGGVGKGRMETQTRSIETATNDLFAGIYGRRVAGDWGLNAALALGYSRHDGQRAVLDNLAGIETATADYSSFYISPAIGLTWSRELANGLEFRPSALLAWTRARYDGYTERGTSSANLKFDSRNENILDGQAQLLLAFTFANGLKTELRGGATLRRYDSDRANVRFAATASAATAYGIPGDDSISGGYGGITVRYAAKQGLNLTSDIEYSRANGGEKGVSVYLGLEYKW